MYICKNSPFPFFYNFPKTHRRCLVQSWAWWVSVPREDFILPLNRCASCGVGKQFPVYHGAAGGKLDCFGKLILFELSISLPWRLLVEREPKVEGSKNPAVSFKNVSAWGFSSHTVSTKARLGEGRAHRGLPPATLRTCFLRSGSGPGNLGPGLIFRACGISIHATVGA